MPTKKSRRERRDINEIAFDLVRSFTEGKKPEEEEPEKNAAAVARGRAGGLKGGEVRAQRLTPEQRTQIAKKAVSIRWAKKKT